MVQSLISDEDIALIT